MATITIQHAPDEAMHQPSRGVMAMACLIIAESAIFTIFVVAYLYFAGRDTQGPRPRDVLEVPYFYTVCLLSSSFFIVLAEHAIDRARMAAFRLWWSVTILLGLAFLYGTATEWRKLIVDDHLTIHTNLFGTTYYSLVGLHASHVVIGLILMLFTLAFAVMGKVEPRHAYNVKVLAMYWHFVDAVWVVVFTVVYVVCR
ncbi:MAG TPA: heme-copper oxidase subunit III [Terracidiphilus sp.]|jgi:cytochrome c oxidase subunit 3/cytochrome o ubiquinol oxidase subunit 3|nr:heme-copper oxidase subunit III [Terracidiphilus sp.]